MKKYDVICPHCCGSFHETTEAFVVDAPAKGHMFRLKTHYVDCGWSAFPPYPDTQYNNLTCPACDQPYVDSRGRVIRLVEVGDVGEARVGYGSVEVIGEIKGVGVPPMEWVDGSFRDGASPHLEERDVLSSIEHPPTPTTEVQREEPPRKRRGRKAKA